MWYLYLQGKCAIYGSQMVPGLSIELQGFVFVLLFSSQVLRSLNAFWSRARPEHLRTLTHPKKHKHDWTSLRLFSLSRLKPPVFFISSVTIVFFSGFQALIQVSIFLPDFVLLLFIAHVLTWFPSPHPIQGVSVSVGPNVFSYKTTEAFVKT